jgi:triphosphoribosyl-dephospho-CoA synthase
MAALVEFDAKLKQHGLNPGTTADFVVTTLFTDALIERKAL